MCPLLSTRHRKLRWMSTSGRSAGEESPYSFIVVGGRVAISTHEGPGETINEYLTQPRLQPN